MISHPSCKVLVAIVGVVLLAGCTYPEASANTVQFSGDIERVDGQFHMEGTVLIDGTNKRDVTDVAVVLYDANQTVIGRIPVGSLSSHSEGSYPTRQPINITTDRLPAYVIIESPNIWTNGADIWTNGVPSRGYRWTGDFYTEYWVKSEDEQFG